MGVYPRRARVPGRGLQVERDSEIEPLGAALVLGGRRGDIRDDLLVGLVEGVTTCLSPCLLVP